MKTVNRIVSSCVAKLQYAENPKPRNYAIRLDAISKASHYEISHSKFVIFCSVLFRHGYWLQISSSTSSFSYVRSKLIIEVKMACLYKRLGNISSKCFKNKHQLT